MKGMGMRAFSIGGAVLLLTWLHFDLADSPAGTHVRDIVLSGLYLLPVTAAAMWFGWRGSILTASLVSGLYYLHIRLAWPDQPSENAHQLAMIAIYWLMAAVAGALVELQTREQCKGRKAEIKAQRDAVIQSIAGLSNALHARDEYTREHSERVAALAVELGRRRGLPSERLELLRLAALAHDIGKIGVRDDVLFKPEILSPEERAAIERHPLIAAEILRPIAGAREIADIVMAHHECPDATGYPRRCKLEDIPFEAHMLRVADVYASLTERRPYKPALPPKAAMRLIDSWAGTKLEAETVACLRDLYHEGRLQSPLASSVDQDPGPETIVELPRQAS